MFIFSMFRFRSYLPTLKGYRYFFRSMSLSLSEPMEGSPKQRYQMADMVNVDGRVIAIFQAQISWMGPPTLIHGGWKRRNTYNPKPQTIFIWKWHHQKTPFMIRKRVSSFQPKLNSHDFTPPFVETTLWPKTETIRIFTKSSWTNKTRLAFPMIQIVEVLQIPWATWCTCNAASGFFDLWRAKISLELIFWYTDLEVSSTYLTPLQLEAQQEHNHFQWSHKKVLIWGLKWELK